MSSAGNLFKIALIEFEHMSRRGGARDGSRFQHLMVQAHGNLFVALA